MFTYNESTITEARLGVNLEALGQIQIWGKLGFDFAIQVVNQNFSPILYDETYYSFKAF